MYIDADIIPTYHHWLFKGLYFIVIVGLVYLLPLSWWQMLAVWLMGGLCLFLDRQPYQLHLLSTKNPKEIWELTMLYDDDEQLWQAYLNDIKVIDVGFLVCLKCTFYIIEPDEFHHSVFIFRSGIDESQFRRLTTLSKFGGYC